MELLQVQPVILLSIDPPITTHPNLLRITIHLWRGFLPHNASHSPATQQRQAHMVREAHWTQAATPLYLLLSDIFRGPAPAAYGNNDRMYWDTVAWQQAIINA